jgi:hypothetical protein
LIRIVRAMPPLPSGWTGWLEQINVWNWGMWNLVRP